MKISLTLSSYLIKRLTLWFCVFFFGIMLLIAIFDFSELMRQASSKNSVELSKIIEMVIMRVPNRLQILLPFIMLFSSMATMWSFNKNSELIVMKASGISVWQILTPLMACAFLIGVFDLTSFSPLSAKMLDRYQHLSKGAQSFSISEAGIWLRKAKGNYAHVFHATNIDQIDNGIQNISILKFTTKDKLVERVSAKVGYSKENSLILKDAWIVPLDKEPTHYEKLEYKIDLKISELLNSNIAPEHLSFWEIPGYIDMSRKSGLSTTRYELHWQCLLARVFWLVTMILVAASCSMRPMRQGGAIKLIASGALLGFSLYIIRDITFSMGQASTIPVFFSAWAPICLTAILGTAVLLHLEEGYY